MNINNLRELINDNTAVLNAELDHQEMLMEQKLERQLEALRELRDEIQPAINEAGYNIALCKTLNRNLYKARSYEEKYQPSKEHAWLIKIEFEYSKCLKDTGESESYYAPHVHYGQHCGSNDPAYIKISWDDTRGAYFMVPNVAYNYNKERDSIDKRTYLELHGTKDMVIERLAVVLANVIRLEINF